MRCPPEMSLRCTALFVRLGLVVGAGHADLHARQSAKRGLIAHIAGERSLRTGPRYQDWNEQTSKDAPHHQPLPHEVQSAAMRSSPATAWRAAVSRS